MNIGSLGSSNLNNINSIRNSVNNSIQKIATGSKHPTAASGASEYAITQRMYSQLGAIEQSNANAQNANAMLNTASGAANNTVNALTTLRENLINAANGTNGDVDREALQKSVDQTVSQINENAGVTYNGKDLLNGSSSVTVAGVDGYNTVNLGNLTSQALGLTDENGNSTLDLSTQEGIESALSTVENALNVASDESSNIDSALDEATTIGAQQQGLDYQSANYTTMAENLQDSISTLDDTDIAAEITKLKSSSTQEQVALYAQKMFMHNASNVLSLLQ